MKWELITLGLGWGCFLFKLYQQYRHSKILYENPHIHHQTAPSPPKLTFYDSAAQPASSNSIVTEQNVPASALQVQKMEGNHTFLPHLSNKKLCITLDTTIDETDFVVFPELYPQLKKKKSIAKRTYLGKAAKQKNKLTIKRKRDTRKYKEWFITNKALFEIQESGQFTSEQMEEHYEKFTKELKSTVIDLQSGSDSVRSEEGTQFGQRYGYRGKFTEAREGKVLGFLEEEDQAEGQSCMINKYDPFE